MCGRGALALGPDEYREAIEAALEDRPRYADDADDYYPTHNVAPHTRVPIVRRDPEGGVGTGGSGSGGGGRGSQHGARGDPTAEAAKEHHVQSSATLVQTMRWGLIPRSAKILPTGIDAIRTINARDDTALSGRSMWTPLLSAQRCVVFLQGFYEWQKLPFGSNDKIAHFIGMKDPGKGRRDKDGRERSLMPIAGLWEKCRLNGEEQDRYTFTILTTESNKQLGFLHDRMPIILPSTAAIHLWLGTDDPTAADAGFTSTHQRLMKPYAAGELDCYKVPSEVGKVGTNSPAFILPVQQRKDGIMAAFGRAKKDEEEKAQTVRGAGEGETAAPKAGTTIKAEEEAIDDRQEAKADVNSESHAPVPHDILKQERDDTNPATSQEESDRRLAEQLQREEEAGAGATIEISSRDRKRSDRIDDQDGEAEDSQDARSPRKRIKTDDGPSSRFSPDPFNPPLSPERPQGGYSRTTTTDRGSSRAGGNKTDEISESGSGDVAALLAQQKKKQEEWAAEVGPQHASPQSPRKTGAMPKKDSPNAKGGSGGGGGGSAAKKQLEGAAKGTKDIRNFFGTGGGVGGR